VQKIHIILDEIKNSNYSNLIDFAGLIFETTIDGTISISKQSSKVPKFNKIIYPKSR